MVKFLFFIILLTSILSNAFAKDIGKVIVAKGKVWASSPQGEKRDLKKGSSIKLSDSLETGKSSLLRVKTTTNTIITLGPSSIIKVIEYKFKEKDNPREEIFSIIKGKVRSAVTKKASEKEKILFRTKAVALGVRGTEFLINEHGDSTDVALLSGSLAVDPTSSSSGIDTFNMSPGKAFNSKDFDSRGMNAVQSMNPGAQESLKNQDTFLPDLNDPAAAAALGMAVGDSGALQIYGSKDKKLQVTDQSQDHVCHGGGVFLTSDTFSIEHKYEEFVPGKECKDVGDPIQIGGAYIQKQATVDKLIAELADGKICPGITGIINDFKDSKANVEKYFSDLEAGRKHLMDQGELVEDVQKDFAYHALTSSFCRSSHVVHRTEVYFYLLNNIFQEHSVGPEYRATRNGQVLSDCAFIKASGDDRVKSFRVSLANARTDQLKIIYNTYSAPDNIKIIAGGKTIHDTGCVGTENEIEQSISVSRLSNPQVTVLIQPDCNFKANSEAWEFSLSCVPKKPIADKCADKLKKLTSAIEVFIDSSKPILNKFWAQSYCYEQLDDQINERSSEVQTFKKIISTDLRGTKYLNSMDRERDAIAALLESTKGKTEESIRNKERRKLLSDIENKISSLENQLKQSGPGTSTTNNSFGQDSDQGEPAVEEFEVIEEATVVEEDLTIIEGEAIEGQSEAVEFKDEDGGTVLMFNEPAEEAAD